MRKGSLAAVSALAISIALSAAPASAQTPSLVLYDGKSVTLDGKSTVATAIAIAGGEILRVGGDRQIRNMASRSTRSVDLGGWTVIPGLVDSHQHVIRAGVTHRSEVDWSDVTSLDQGLARIAAAAKARPGQWVLVPGGWHVDQLKEGREPTSAELAKSGGKVSHASGPFAVLGAK